jgi:RES domain-containing protein
MIVYRLARKAFKDDLKGIGAEKYGGRWNNIGVPLLYTCQHRSLAVLEVAAHMQLTQMPIDFYMVEIEIPDNDIRIVSEHQLPYKWMENPHNSLTQNFGDDFVRENKFLAMLVPSAIVKQEFNLLINPNHIKANKIEIVESYPFVMDGRLLR